MPSLRAEPPDLVVSLEPWERVAALRREVRVPLSALRAVRVEPQPWGAIRGLRAPGTGFPGLIAYGTWRATGDRKDFLAVLRRHSCVLVELDPPSPFARLLIAVADPEATAARLEASRP